MIDDVRGVLEETGLNPAALVLEITESLFMREFTVVIERLHALKQLGVRLAIDDFGTGYSSLSYLQQFPIDILKIDQSFVARLEDSPEQRAIVHALIELGRALNLEIIAEGVESDAQGGCSGGSGVTVRRGTSSPRHFRHSISDSLPGNGVSEKSGEF